MPRQFYSCFLPTTPQGATRYIAVLEVGLKTETLVLNGDDNTEADGPATYPGKARVSGNRRRIGLRACHCVLRAQNPAGAGYTANSYIRVPLLNQVIQTTAYNQAVNPDEDFTVTYAGGSLWNFISFSPEYLDGLPPF